jgi:vitamin B12 transporter
MLFAWIPIAACCILGDSSNTVEMVEPPTMGDTVFIKAERNDFATVGKRQYRLTLSETPQILTQSLQQSAQFLKEYGISGAATISKRGADATQTQVLWNGLPINHPMLGMLDFNAGSTFGMDELVLIEGGNSAMYGSGSVGGTVLLNNLVHFDQPFKANLAVEYNSMANIQTGLQVSKSSKNTYFNIAYSHIQKENRFAFWDPMLQKNRNSENVQISLQNLRLVGAHKMKNHQLKAIVEQGFAERGLGFLYGSEKGLGQQFDAHYRGLLHYDWSRKKGHFTQKYGYVKDQLVYVESGGTGDTSNAIMHYFQSEWVQITRLGKLFLGFDYQIQQGKTRFYEETKTRILPALFTAIKGEMKKVDYLVNARYEFHEGVFTGGIGTQTSLNPYFKVKADIHKSFRRPTLNDLYWSTPSVTVAPLKPEIGWSAELGIICQYQKDLQKFQMEVTPFYRELNHPLIWLPRGTFWAAQNLHFGRYYGIQWNAVYDVIWGKHQWMIKQELEWVRTRVRYTEFSTPVNQIFIPDIMATGTLAWNYSSWRAHAQLIHTGNRYSATDNSQWLKHYSLISFEISYSFKPKKGAFTGPIFCGVGTQNATNVTYQNMPGRPMPPQNFYVKTSINF